MKESEMETGKDDKDFLKRKFLRIPSVELDVMIDRAASRAESETDCLACAKCCITLNPAVREDEIPRLSALLGMDADEFKDTHLEPLKTGEAWFMRNRPCVFLNGKSCSIYDQRPASCRAYPHLHQPGLKFRQRILWENQSLCPITQKVIQSLRREFEDRSAEGSEPGL